MQVRRAPAAGWVLPTASPTVPTPFLTTTADVGDISSVGPPRSCTLSVVVPVVLTAWRKAWGLAAPILELLLLLLLLLPVLLLLLLLPLLSALPVVCEMGRARTDAEFGGCVCEGGGGAAAPAASATTTAATAAAAVGASGACGVWGREGEVGSRAGGVQVQGGWSALLSLLCSRLDLLCDMRRWMSPHTGTRGTSSSGRCVSAFPSRIQRAA